MALHSSGQSGGVGLQGGGEEAAAIVCLKATTFRLKAEATPSTPATHLHAGPGAGRLFDDDGDGALAAVAADGGRAAAADRRGGQPTAGARRPSGPAAAAAA